MHKIDLFKDYENAKLDTVQEFKTKHKASTYKFSELADNEIDGIPICMSRDEKGNLEATFIPDSHLLAIGATRSGKTTGYVIPTLNVLMRKKNKPNFVISDPKQELFSDYSGLFEEQGYNVYVINFTDYLHSDCWNPLTKYFRFYQKQFSIPQAVTVQTDDGPKQMYEGKIYEDREELDTAISEAMLNCVEEAEKGITAICNVIIPQNPNAKDPFWEDSARNLLHAILLGMLEDSAPGGTITEDNFSFDTVLKIFDSFSDSPGHKYDRGFFTERPHSSKAYQLASKCILEQASNTRLCISSTFASIMSKFRDIAIRRVTCTNTIDMERLDDTKNPSVIFVAYKDEESLHYEIISLFLSNLYTELIAAARKKNSKLSKPFYFLLDEFGNLPKFNDFDKVISACGGRNIWFLLILQSYSQLNNVYGSATAEIIKDNMNVHVFFGTNNPQTKRAFSDECGRKTVITPVSALNGKGETITSYSVDTVSLVPVSALDQLKTCECIVTQMRENILWSRIERSYLCPEFDYHGPGKIAIKKRVDFSNPKYSYNP